MRGIDPDLAALQEVRDEVAKAKAAHKIAATWDQATTDRVCAAMAQAAARAAHDLARLAVEETGIGRVHYKILKNLFGSEGVWDSIKGEKTCGFLKQDDRAGIWEVATPVGVVAGIVPTTNPTSTTMYKALISVKGRNAVVISPHPRAVRCISETVEVLRRAIARAGGPPDLVTVLTRPTIEATSALMKHRDVAVILSTGGSGLVRAAYSSGKPAYGVGPGNVPAFVDRSAKAEDVARHIVTSQSFDNGTLCCSEQALVLDAPIAEAVLAALVRRGAHLCTEEETRKLERYCNQDGHMNPEVVGLDPWKVAEQAGFQVKRHTSVLLAHQGGVGPAHPLSIEILCPLLSVHVVNGWEEGCKVSKEILHYGGLGHTMAVHASQRSVLEAFALDKPASRIVVNGPSSMGAVGFSTNLAPSFSLGCGPYAGNITSDNITARHLVSIKRIAFPKADWASLESEAHRRAGEMTGDLAPRGSGMAGDPALGKGDPGNSFGAERLAGGADLRLEPVQRKPEAPGSAPSSKRVAEGGTSPSPAAGAGCAKASCGCADLPAPAPRPAPTFVSSGAPRPAKAAGPPSGSSHGTSALAVGSSLRRDEIEAILTHAGSGCPLGPCQGCPHQEVKTGACKA